MSTIIDWTAFSVSAIERDKIRHGPAQLDVHGGPSSDEISTAVNNVRLVGDGWARRGWGLALWTVTATTEFFFGIGSSGALRANVSLAPQGSYYLFGQRKGAPWDEPGRAQLHLSAKMAVQVRDERNVIVRRATATRLLLEQSALGENFSRTVTGSLNVSAFDEILSRDMNCVVHPNYFVEIRGTYTLQALASGGGRFDIDFGSFHSPNDPPGDGLNMPFASISVI